MSRPLSDLQNPHTSLRDRTCTSESRRIFRKWFIYREFTHTALSNSLIYRLITFARLCNPLITRLCTVLHVNQNFFPQTFLARLHPNRSTTPRHFHASKMLTSISRLAFSTFTKPALYRSIVTLYRELEFFHDTPIAPFWHTLHSGFFHLPRTTHLLARNARTANLVLQNSRES